MILSQSEADEFFAMMAALDLYTNRRFGCVPGLDDGESIKRAGARDRLRLREARLADPSILDDFARDNPSGLPDASLDAARRLRHAVSGRFFVERVLKSHAIFITATERPVVYAVGALTERIDDIVSRVHAGGTSALVDAALVPWRGRIVWDGLVSVVPVYLGPGIRRSFKDVYTKAKARGEIVTTLGDAVVQRPKRPTRDWRPAVAEIVAGAEKLGKPESALQAATFALLDRSARLAQAALDRDPEAVGDAIRKAERALRRVKSTLED